MRKPDSVSKDVVAQLMLMKHSPIENYIVPGLTSWMIANNGPAGKVRMFESTREQHEFITPHSHRFNFSACVVAGQVENTLWFTSDGNGDMYQETQTIYKGNPGEYEIKNGKWNRYLSDSLTHSAGDWYSMKFHEIHSIKFSRGALVVFFEGPTLTDTSYAIEPVVDCTYINTMKTEPWMFKRGRK